MPRHSRRCPAHDCATASKLVHTCLRGLSVTGGQVINCHATGRHGLPGCAHCRDTPCRSRCLGIASERAHLALSFCGGRPLASPPCPIAALCVEAAGLVSAPRLWVRPSPLPPKSPSKATDLEGPEPAGVRPHRRGASRGSASSPLFGLRPSLFACNLASSHQHPWPGASLQGGCGLHMPWDVATQTLPRPSLPTPSTSLRPECGNSAGTESLGTKFTALAPDMAPLEPAPVRRRPNLKKHVYIWRHLSGGS